MVTVVFVDGWKCGSSQCLMGYPRIFCAISHDCLLCCMRHLDKGSTVGVVCLLVVGVLRCWVSLCWVRIFVHVA